jgi:hypothetical protein
LTGFINVSHAKDLTQADLNQALTEITLNRAVALTKRHLIVITP